MEELYRSQFRLPWALYEQLKERAEVEGRSLNAEVVKRLEASFDPVDFLGVQVHDQAGQAAVLEVMLLVRQLDVAELLDLLREIVPAIPNDLRRNDPALDTNLRFMGKLIKRLTLSPSRVAQISEEYERKYRGAVEHIYSTGAVEVLRAAQLGESLKSQATDKAPVVKRVPRSDKSR